MQEAFLPLSYATKLIRHVDRIPVNEERVKDHLDRIPHRRYTAKNGKEGFLVQLEACRKVCLELNEKSEKERAAKRFTKAVLDAEWAERMERRFKELELRITQIERGGQTMPEGLYP